MKKAWAPSILVAMMLLAASMIAEAQQAGKVPRIGVLVSTSGSIAKPRLKAFQDGLRELGYVEGKNIVLEFRSAEGRPETLPKRVDELVQLNVDVIVTETSNATQAAKKATTMIPVVFATANDPVGDGHVASLARPGGNITGFSNLAPELNGKKLELLKEAVFRVTGVAFLLRWGTSIGEQRFNETEIAAKDLGLRLLPLSAKGNEDLESAFSAVKSAGAEALIVSPSTFSIEHRRGIVELAAKYLLPAIYPSPLFVQAGGLMSYGPDLNNNWRRAAVLVDKILKGTKPAGIPVEQPVKFELVINLKTAKQIGLTIPPNVLARADRVIRWRVSSFGFLVPSCELKLEKSKLQMVSPDTIRNAPCALLVRSGAAAEQDFRISFISPASFENRRAEFGSSERRSIAPDPFALCALLAWCFALGA